MRQTYIAIFFGAGLLLSIHAASHPAAGPADSVTRGKYLVDHVAMCGECHTPRNDKGEILSGQYLKGAPIPVSPPPSRKSCRCFLGLSDSFATLALKSTQISPAIPVKISVLAPRYRSKSSRSHRSEIAPSPTDLARDSSDLDFCEIYRKQAIPFARADHGLNGAFVACA